MYQYFQLNRWVTGVPQNYGKSCAPFLVAQLIEFTSGDIRVLILIPARSALPCSFEFVMNVYSKEGNT